MLQPNNHNIILTKYLEVVKKMYKPARISPKEKRGASGGFLPRPLLLRLRHPNSEKRNQPKFCGILSPENSFRKTSSALFPFHSLGFSAKWVLTFSNKHHKKILGRKNGSRPRARGRRRGARGATWQAGGRRRPRGGG